MKIPNTQTVQIDQIKPLIDFSKKMNWLLEYDSDKHQLIANSQEDWLFKLFLPWNYQINSNWELIKLPDFHLGVVAIRSGQAVCAYFHEDELLDHKVFRAYMVRKKQGKSQIKYLNTKGKSRAGSRIRLEETERFFEEINGRLQYYHSTYPIERWGIACSKTLWPYFFQSEISPPFDQQSSSLWQLPVHFNQASFEEIKALGKVLFQGHLLLAEEKQNALANFKLTKSQEDENTDEDW